MLGWLCSLPAGCPDNIAGAGCQGSTSGCAALDTPAVVIFKKRRQG